MKETFPYEGSTVIVSIILNHIYNPAYMDFFIKTKRFILFLNFKEYMKNI